MCFFGGKLQIDAKNSNFEICESTLYMKSGNMPLNNILGGEDLTSQMFRPSWAESKTVIFFKKLFDY